MAGRVLAFVVVEHGDQDVYRLSRLSRAFLCVRFVRGYVVGQNEKRAQRVIVATRARVAIVFAISGRPTKPVHLLRRYRRDAASNDRAVPGRRSRVGLRALHVWPARSGPSHVGLYVRRVVCDVGRRTKHDARASAESFAKQRERH